MPRHLGPGGGGGGGTQLPRHMGPPGPKIGGDPHACDTGRIVYGIVRAKWSIKTKNRKKALMSGIIVNIYGGIYVTKQVSCHGFVANSECSYQPPPPPPPAPLVFGQGSTKEGP